MANPFLDINTYIADGEPHVFGDRVYLFGSHDIAGATPIVCWIIHFHLHLWMTWKTGQVEEYLTGQSRTRNTEIS